MTNATATLIPNVTPANLIDATVYRLTPPLNDVEYVAASTVTAEDNPLIALLFGAEKHTALFITDGDGADADPDKFIGSTESGLNADIPEAFASLGYEVAA